MIRFFDEEKERNHHDSANDQSNSAYRLSKHWTGAVARRGWKRERRRTKKKKKKKTRVSVYSATGNDQAPSFIYLEYDGTFLVARRKKTRGFRRFLVVEASHSTPTWHLIYNAPLKLFHPGFSTAPVFLFLLAIPKRGKVLSSAWNNFIITPDIQLRLTFIYRRAWWQVLLLLRLVLYLTCSFSRPQTRAGRS